MRKTCFAFALGLITLGAMNVPVGSTQEAASSQEIECVNIFHDETDESWKPGESGPINAIMLANLLGHWPKYEVRARPIHSYTTTDMEACKATFFLATTDDAEISDQFLKDYFETLKSVAWIGFSLDQLDAAKFEERFGHRVSGMLDIDNDTDEDVAFYQYISYKDSLFHKLVDTSSGKPEGAFSAVRFLPARRNARDFVAADLIHNKTYHSNPYFLRSENKFVVGDIPFSYMHEADRYFAFADLLFDILGEAPVRTEQLAFARIEDIHAHYELPVLKATIESLKSEGVPVSMTHIPTFMDPLNAFGAGTFQTPEPATKVKKFTELLKEVRRDPRHAIIWHGVTHQFGLDRNPHTGTSGDDYEFWDMVKGKPVDGASVDATLDRLASALPVFASYDQQPRYWVTPHYLASAQDNQVFGKVFPWQVGRVTYFSSSFGPAFTLAARSRQDSLQLEPVTAGKLTELKSRNWKGLDVISAEPLTQMFPYEIYRDVYDQRLVPETLNYLSYQTSDQTAFVRTVDDMLADARRNKVVRDYWASFFVHPYIFSSKANGGIGKFNGDTFELRKLLIGLKLLGYRFTGLSEFEDSLKGSQERRADLEKPSLR
jgi:uncharacterized protein YdaL